MIPENSGKVRKYEQLPVAGRVSRVSSVSLWIWEEGSLQNSAKGKTSQEYSRFLEKTPQNPRGLLSTLPLGHLNVPGLVSTFLYVNETQFQARTHHITIENTEIMVIHDWDSTENRFYLNLLQFSDFLNAVAAHLSKAEDGANCVRNFFKCVRKCLYTLQIIKLLDCLLS